MHGGDAGEALARNLQSRFAASLYQSCIEAGFTPNVYQQVVEVQG
jgi:hypothetical protein